MTLRLPTRLVSFANAPISMLTNGTMGITVPFGDGHIEVESFKFNEDETVTIEGEYFETGEIPKVTLGDLEPE